MSRVKPGYFTVFNAFFTCSSEIDILELTCGARQVNRTLSETLVAPRLPVLVLHSVANLIIGSAGETGRLLVGFRQEVWFLPLGPVPVFRLHWICREMDIEDPV